MDELFYYLLWPLFSLAVPVIAIVALVKAVGVRRDLTRLNRKSVV